LNRILKMPHGALVTDHEREQIKALHECGMSIRAIAGQLKRSSSLVRHALQRGLDQPAKLSGGRKRKLGEEEDQAILDFVAANGNSSSAQIKSTLNLNVSERTIQRALRRREQEQLLNAPPKRKPPLKDENKLQRLEWIAQYKNWTSEWNSVLFLGGRRFTLTGPDNECSWLGLGAEKDIRTAVHDSNAPGFEVWLTFSPTIKGEIVILQNDMNSPAFKQYCERILVPAAQAVRHETATEEDGIVFYHNDTSIPRTEKFADDLELLNLRPLVWPVRSPDLNPLEYVFTGLARMVYSSPIEESTAIPVSSNQRQVTYTSLEELKEAIQASWNSILISDLAQEVLMMTANMLEIEKNGGGHIAKGESRSKKQFE